MISKEYIISIDLGTTLIKCIIYNSNLERLADCSIKYNLNLKDKFVEFDADDYWNCLKVSLKKLINQSGINVKHIIAIGLSGQAETFVILDKKGNPLRKAISWLDQRSDKEVEEIKKNFNENRSYGIVGLQKIVTTCTATKLLWLKNNEPDIYTKIKKILLLKDYVAFKFTGLFLTEYTTHNFSYYLDIYKKQYWEDILNYLGIEIKQLPELSEPGVNVGKLTLENIKYFNFKKEVFLNIGANDQFAGMIGVGNITEGILSESTGTVLALATMANSNHLNGLKKINLPVYYNALKDTYVYLMTCESGGICLEWLKNNFFKEKSFKELDQRVARLEKGSKGLIFLPYILGTNSPEYEPNMSGGFFNIRIFHDEIYFVRAVMEGIGFLIKKNLTFLEKNNIKTKSIISMGGGSKSSIWNKIKADITGKKIIVTTENDPVGLGIAILMALELDYFTSLKSAVTQAVHIKEEFVPEYDANYDENYKNFKKYYGYLKSS